MAKRQRKSRKSAAKAKSAGKLPGKTIAHHNYESKSFRCYGKRVNKRGGGTVARIFCAKAA